GRNPPRAAACPKTAACRAAVKKSRPAPTTHRTPASCKTAMQRDRQPPPARRRGAHHLACPPACPPTMHPCLRRPAPWRPRPTKRPLFSCPTSVPPYGTRAPQALLKGQTTDVVKHKRRKITFASRAGFQPMAWHL